MATIPLLCAFSASEQCYRLSHWKVMYITVVELKTIDTGFKLLVT